jgi:diguanylate cyclase (GGDEF)-like protein
MTDRLAEESAPESGVSPAQLAHDARGPLSVIQAHARMLIDGRRGELSQEQLHSLAIIEQQTQRLERMVDELHGKPAPAPGPPSSATGRAVKVEASRARLLVVDDDESLRELLGELLSPRYELTFAKDGAEAVTALGRERFAVAIVDLELPRKNGFTVAEFIRGENAREGPAFIFLSAQNSPETKVRGLLLGAADYVTKPFDPDELLARVGRVVSNVEREASLRADAMTDSLTGLLNSRSLDEALAHELARARRYGEPLSLITLDLDHLKRINDEHGHDAGNEAIRTVAEVLKASVRSFEIVARQGGDEFAVLLPNTTRTDAEKLGRRLCERVSAAVVCGVNLSASVGVAAREVSDTGDGVSLIKASDQALYRAKRAGRGRVEVG